MPLTLGKGYEAMKEYRTMQHLFFDKYPYTSLARAAKTPHFLKDYAHLLGHLGK
jgi:hypothetical protein